MIRRPTASIVASPVLVGAVTVLVAMVSVLLAVSANSGLPFVPTYDLRAEVPGGANLVVGNEVRLGGFRVGVVDRISPGVTEQGDKRAIAVLSMKLDKTIEPLPADTTLTVRPRSALGLKFVELTRGRARRELKAGATLPLAQALEPVELDDFFNTFDSRTRSNQRTAIEGFGNAFAGRGTSINRAIEELPDFMRHLEPVMRTLSDRNTRLGRFFQESGRLSAQIAPVASTYASLFSNMATTFEALSRHDEQLRTAIERGAPTLDEGIRSFPVQRPFLRDTGELARLLEPVAEEIDRSLPGMTAAIETGSPVLDKAPPLYRRTRNVFRAVDTLASNPNTLLALRDLHRTLEVAAPLVTHIAPYQTVCNYWNYYWTGIGEHVSEQVPGGTIQRTLLKSDSRIQDNRLSDSTADRPVDVPSNQDPQTAKALTGDALQALHRGAYEPAIDAQGNADCQVGQRGYLAGPLVTGSPYPPSTVAAEGGGSHVVLDPDMPGLAGGTYVARRLGIDNVEDVP